MRVGLIGDMSRDRECRRRDAIAGRRFSARGFLDWRAARRFAERIIARLRRALPIARTRAMRLLSGGNMQKLILGRVLSPAPRFILANQPTRGLDVGAVAYVHAQPARGARRAALRSLLISEDLDEILALVRPHRR